MIHSHASATNNRISGATYRLAWMATATTALIVLGAWLVHHPLGALLPALALAVYTSALVIRPQWWLIMLPVLWPVADLTPWTGRIHFTESDALVLATIAGVGLHAALAQGGGPTAAHRPLRPRLAGIAVFTLLLASYTASTLHALPSDTWTTAGPALLVGYGTPLNALRLAKGLVAAVVLIPCLHLAAHKLGERTLPWLSAGLAGGLLSASLAAIWERMAFPGLSNFAADYRTTGLFWEMNVGGAALDGWLALTLPFALLMLLRERRPGPALLLAILVVAAGYATFTTFSRGLYAAVAVAGLILLPAALNGRDTGDTDIGVTPQRRFGPLIGTLLWLALAVGATLSFSSGGYRGMAAWLGFSALLGAGGDLLRRTTLGALLAAIALTAAVAVLAGLASTLPKGAYFAYAMLWLTAAALLGLQRKRKHNASPLEDSLALASIFGCGATAIFVARHWSATGASLGATGAFVLTLAIALTHRYAPAPLWSTRGTDLIKQTVLLGAACLVALAGASYYLGTRFSTVDRDLSGRMEHWRTSASLVDSTTDELIGIGTGRYPDAYFWKTPNAAFPGTMEWHEGTDGDGAPFLRLGGPHHTRGFGELFRISQRIPGDVKAPFRIEMRVRAKRGLRIHIEVCRRNLLYPEGCTTSQIGVAGSADWQTVRFATGRTKLAGAGSWYAPRPATLSIANNSAYTLDIAEIRATDATGRSFLVNGDFRAGFDRWFFSSDRHHLPWHAKNMFLHLWVEQGALGLGAVAAALGLAMLRLTRPRSYRSGPAPAVLAALAGFAVVGLFDSLLDAPRLSVFFFLLLWVALSMPQTPLADITTSSGKRPR